MKMKTMVFVLLSFVLTSETSAQTMIESGNAWSYLNLGRHMNVGEFEEWKDCEYTFTKVYFDGEREVNGKKYLDLWLEEVFLDEQICSDRQTEAMSDEETSKRLPYESIDDFEQKISALHWISIREDDESLYVLASLFEEPNIFNYWNKEADTLMNGEFVFTKSYRGDGYEDYDVNICDTTLKEQGIGNILNLLHILPLKTNTVLIDGISRTTFLNLFYRKGELVYTSPWFYTDPFFPTVTGINEVSSDKKRTHKGIYNLQGQRISHAQKGLNIIDGRKVFAR